MSEIPIDIAIRLLVARIAATALSGVQAGMDPDETWELAFHGFHLYVHEGMEVMRPEYDKMAFTLEAEKGLADLPVK